MTSLRRRTALSLLLAGGAATTAAQGTPIRGGTLVANIVPEPQNLVGGIAISAPAVAISANIFDTLVEYGPDLSLNPGLAEAWEEADGGRTITFRLRQGVRWHDGAPFTAADVRFSLLELMQKVHPRGGAYYAQLR